MKSNSDVRPPIILDLGNGSYHYNYNIQEVEAPADPIQEGEGPKRGFEYDTVLIWGRPNKDSVTKAVLRSRRDETEEFNLINKYNSFVLGISTNPADKAEYEAYLAEVQGVKEMVQIDLLTASY